MKHPTFTSSIGIASIIALVAISIVVSDLQLQGQVSSQSGVFLIDDTSTEVTIPANTHVGLQYMQGNTFLIDQGANQQGDGEWRVYEYDGTEPPYKEKNFFLSPALRQQHTGAYDLTTMQPKELYYIFSDTTMIFSPLTGLRLLSASQSSLSSSQGLHPAAGPVCGNGDPSQGGNDTEDGEECDDGNLVSGDGCSGTDHPNGTCTAEFCGDGYHDADGINGLWPEECDDGSVCYKNGVPMIDTAGNAVQCSAFGYDSVCGGDDTECLPISFDGCSNNCTLEYCGDGEIIPEAGEQCDDDNSQSDDGCSSICKVENGWTCSGMPSVCNNNSSPSGPVCGNGDPSQGGNDAEDGEECDDGNLVSGDGCSGTDHPNGGCTAEFCGDGYHDADGIQGLWPEECDDAGYCFAEDTSPWPENALLDAQGNRIRCTTMGWPDQLECGEDAECIVASFDGCDTSCITEFCGDGIFQPPGKDGFLGTPDDEECDGTPGCSSTCKKTQPAVSSKSSKSSVASSPPPAPVCGNGVKEGDEQCDDGSSNGSVCTPGYGSSCSYCSNECKTVGVVGPRCGDSNTDTQHSETCDQGPSNGSVCVANYNGTCNYCASDCKDWITVQGSYCGDGNIDTASGEECDDNNTTNGDGCDSTCKNEAVASCGEGLPLKPWYESDIRIPMLFTSERWTTPFPSSNQDIFDANKRRKNANKMQERYNSNNVPDVQLCDPEDAVGIYGVNADAMEGGIGEIVVNSSSCVALVIAGNPNDWIVGTVNGSAISEVITVGTRIRGVPSSRIQNISVNTANWPCQRMSGCIGNGAGLPGFINAGRKYITNGDALTQLGGFFTLGNYDRFNATRGYIAGAKDASLMKDEWVIRTPVNYVVYKTGPNSEKHYESWGPYLEDQGGVGPAVEPSDMVSGWMVQKDDIGNVVSTRRLPVAMNFVNGMKYDAQRDVLYGIEGGVTAKMVALDGISLNVLFEGPDLQRTGQTPYYAIHILQSGDPLLHYGSRLGYGSAGPFFETYNKNNLSLIKSQNLKLIPWMILSRTVFPPTVAQTVLDAEKNILYAIAIGRTGDRYDQRSNTYLSHLVSIDTNTLSIIDSVRTSVSGGYSNAITSLHSYDKERDRLILGSIGTSTTSIFDTSGRGIQEIFDSQNNFYRAKYYPDVGKLSGTLERYNIISGYNIVNVEDGSKTTSGNKCGQ